MSAARIKSLRNVHAPFNTLGMARGWIESDGVVHVATHKDIIKVAQLERV